MSIFDAIIYITWDLLLRTWYWKNSVRKEIQRTPASIYISSGDFYISHSSWRQKTFPKSTLAWRTYRFLWHKLSFQKPIVYKETRQMNRQQSNLWLHRISNGQHQRQESQFYNPFVTYSLFYLLSPKFIG